MKEKGKMYFLCLFFLIIMIYGVQQIMSIVNEYKIGNDTYKILEKYADYGMIDLSMQVQSSDNLFLSIDFSSLKEINDDVTAWIYHEQLNINYPVVQGNDNNYYLNHMINGETNSAGSIFLDYRNDSSFSSRHSIIYGHNMRNGSMFSNLVKYKNQKFFDEHPVYYLITPLKSYKVEIFSGYIVDVRDDAWKVDFSSDDEFQNWLNMTKSNSFFNSNIVPGINDKIVTLSTCSGDSVNNRFVLVGVLVEF